MILWKVNEAKKRKRKSYQDHQWSYRRENCPDPVDISNDVEVIDPRGCWYILSVNIESAILMDDRPSIRIIHKMFSPRIL